MFRCGPFETRESIGLHENEMMAKSSWLLLCAFFFLILDVGAWRWPERSVMTVAHVEIIPRGGGIFGKMFPGIASSNSYQKLLEEQKTLLERQLRQSREEMALLRKQIKKLSSKSVSKTEADAKAKEEKERHLAEVKTLNKQVESLKIAVVKLSEMKDRLEQLIESERAKVADLEAKLKQAGQGEELLKAKYEKQLMDLRAEMEAKAAQQLKELKNIMEEQMRQATARLEETLKSEAQTRLKEEQKKAAQAVEKEKVKMRKLVQALAEREKKLLAAAESNAQKTIRADGATSVGSSTFRKQPKAGTVRSPFK